MAKTGKQIYILWDHAHIWGLMAWRACQSFGLDCRIVKAENIAQQDYLGKSHGVLLAPGGNARLKSLALGRTGRDIIRAWLKNGSFYLGFCGGAGLALNQGDSSLGICPWQRASYAERFYHLLSGNVIVRTNDNETRELPVWWPGRFQPEENNGLEILARYESPGPNLWLADLPLSKLPVNLELFQKTGFHFPASQPLVIYGQFGKGAFILSYAHLETPDSASANLWLTQIMNKYFNIDTDNAKIQTWDTFDCPEPCFESELTQNLWNGFQKLRNLVMLGEELRLLFRRQPWLWGWQPGLPGMSINHLLAAFSTIFGLEPVPAAISLWRQKQAMFFDKLDIFLNDSERFFWEMRLARTLDHAGKTALPQPELHRLGLRLFGHPMLGGGIASQLLNLLEEMIYYSQEGKGEERNAC